jgi:hypothetical protein
MGDEKFGRLNYHFSACHNFFKTDANNTASFIVKECIIQFIYFVFGFVMIIYEKSYNKYTVSKRLLNNCNFFYEMFL